MVKVSKDKKPLLSIIIPILNGERYIENCINSINNNKKDVIEIIIINDGSTDNTSKEVKKLQKKYSNISFYEMGNNKGTSYCRNYGIDKATTPYITFVDCDDYVSNTIYEKALKKLTETNADVLVFSYKEKLLNGNMINSKYNFVNEIIFKEESVRRFLTDKISPAIWDKIYSKKIFEKVKFENRLLVGEDILFCLEMFNSINSVCLFNEVGYYYVQEQTSVMHRLNNKLLQFKEVCNSIDKNIYQQLSDLYQKEFEYFKQMMYTRGIHSISSISNKYNRKDAIKFLREYTKDKNMIKSIINSDMFSKSIRLEVFILNIFGERFHLLLMPIYKKVRNKSRQG